MIRPVARKRAQARGLRLTRALGRDERGITVVEFAIVAPVMCLMLAGAFDISHTLYMTAQLQGVIQKVTRDSALESGAATTRQEALDAKLTREVKVLANNADVQITRKWYRTFSDAAAAKFEPFTDANGNGTCDGPQGATPGELYEDNNNNGNWDRNGGNGGQGGAKDAVVYTATITYPSFFPLFKFIGGSGTTIVKASTVLRNQPYGDQAPPTVRNCT
ncbi:MAG: pilus assembly protein [Sphingomonas sp.]|uniref:TadE/TadG family type IV pilus assembly protein n=1 Tax=Sphingomonas sp. TaxID=28214 RepID=UPI001B1C83B5|nr:TadE/TadG family type IV pilus assembly protein [Sphingomonas sp.]MBO9622799.1 pilus assembly protein [Sphingomonas sp.]